MLSEMAKISMLSTLEALIQAIPKKNKTTPERGPKRRSVLLKVLSLVLLKRNIHHIPSRE